jgi:hypothetical protein
MILRNVCSARTCQPMVLYHNWLVNVSEGSYYLLRYCLPLVMSWTFYLLDCSQWLFSEGRNGMIYFSFASPICLPSPCYPVPREVDPYWLCHQCHVLCLLLGLPREW